MEVPQSQPQNSTLSWAMQMTLNQLLQPCAMEEFSHVDQAARLFELSSGCSLHWDPLVGKCKVLPLGRWRNKLQQEDFGHHYMKLCDTLSFVGVELIASWRATRKINNDELVTTVHSCIQYQHLLPF